jgi:ornithine cyclodeaminase
MLIVDRATVHHLLPMADAIALMRDAFRAHADGNTYQPLRSAIDPPQLDGLAVLMPAHLESHGFGAKIVTAFPQNNARGMEAIQGFVVVLDPETGALQALVEGAAITEVRTAAVSAVATQALARPDGGDIAILGAGVQARSHLIAMASVCPVQRVRVWNRTTSRAHALAKWAEPFDLNVELADSVPEALDGADVICTTLACSEPIVDEEMLSPGAHINAIGAFTPTTRELSSSAVAKATIFVDSMESALAEAGDLLIPMGEGVIERSDIAAELSEVVAGRHPGRTTSDQVTLFKSLGLAFEDVAAAAHVARVARERRMGAEVPFP